jgi:hypothetical protein
MADIYTGQKSGVLTTHSAQDSTSQELSIASRESAQLELSIERKKEADRNLHLGGRSFYFFDFDDNVAYLTTPLILFHKKTGEELRLSSAEWALAHSLVGVPGAFEEYEIRWDDQTGTFRCFRDHQLEELQRLGLKKQIFVHDIAEALISPDFQWKGPSWSCFYHATFNQRPISVITARGHDPSTIKDGIRLMAQAGFLPMEPNYLSVFPVSHKPTRHVLGDIAFTRSTAELKQAAIRMSVEMALQKYGYSPHHRFGMSDDDPKNIQLITEEMTRLKAKYPEMSFFMIETQKGEFVKHEITTNGATGSYLSAEAAEQQIRLF